MIENQEYNLTPQKPKDQKTTTKQELGPEIIKKILEKVKDINSYGTAYTAIGRIPYPESLENPDTSDDYGVRSNLSKKTLTNIFKNGLSDALENTESAKDYKEKINKKKSGVMFNIIGRSSHTVGNGQSIIKNIKHGGFVNYMEIPSEIGLIFNLKNFRESTPITHTGKAISSKHNFNLNRFSSAYAGEWNNLCEELNDKNLTINDPRIKEYLNKERKHLQKLELEIIKLKEKFKSEFNDFKKSNPKYLELDENGKLKYYNIHLKWESDWEIKNKLEEKKGEIHKIRFLLNGFDENGLPCPDEEEGFVLHPRIAPRNFQGIILNKYENTTELQRDRRLVGARDYQDKLRDKQGNLDEEIIKLKNKGLIENVAKVLQEVYSDKLDLLMPIYDIEGNLLWPVEMNYEKVKEFIAKKTITIYRKICKK